MGIFSGRASPRTTFLANPRKLQTQKQKIRRWRVEDMTVPSSPCFRARLGYGAPGSPRGTPRPRSAGSRPSAPLRGQRGRKGAQETHFISKTFRCYSGRLGAGSVSPGTVRERTRCGGATPPLPPCAELTNHRLKTREGNLLVLNGLCGVALAQICLHLFPSPPAPPKTPSPVWKCE